jgi:hypothetical protein
MDTCRYAQAAPCFLSPPPFVIDSLVVEITCFRMIREEIRDIAFDLPAALRQTCRSLFL